MIIGPNGERCNEMVRHKKIVFSGPRTSTVYLMNPKRCKVKTIKVDGCAILEGKRCDWMARTCGNLAEEIFIELKTATRIQKAVHQFEASIKKLSKDATSARKRCVLVCTSVSVISTAIQKFKVQFKRNYNAELSIVRDRAEIPLES
jgi:hypothetical protein